MRERAVIYARYSSEKQTEQSIEGQLHVCKEYAEKNNLNIVGTYIDRAKTGRNDNREGFQNLLKDSANKSFSIVLVYALDRFSRDRYDSAVHKATLKKNGVKLISATQPISSSPEGILLESLLEGLAEYYSVELAQKVARGRRESIDKGQYIGGFITHGYQVIDKKFVIHEEEAKTVKLIYDLYLQSFSYVEIRNYLKQNLIFNRNGGFFKEHQIKNILTNQAYIGVLKSGNLINQNAIPPIIDKEKFLEVQMLMKTKYKRQSVSNENFLLSGKIFCGECDIAMIGDSGTSKSGKTYYYYTCLNHKKRKICQSPSLPKEKIETFVANAIRTNLDGNYLQAIITDVKQVISESSYEQDIEKIKREIQSVKKKLSNIAQAVANGIINDDIKNQNESLLEKQYNLENKLSEMQGHSLANLTDEKISKFVSKYLSKSDEILLNIILNKVIIYKNEIIIIINMPDDTTKKLSPNSNPFSETNSKSEKCSTKFPVVEVEAVSSNTIKVFIHENRVLVAIIKPFDKEMLK